MNVSIASTNVSRPYLATRSRIRRSPTRAAATPAHMSPTRKSGSRLLTFMISITDWFGRPSSISLIAGSRRPSWKISLASLEIEPGAIPPTSFQWAMFAVQATSSSPANTGSTRTTSFRWVTPP